MPATSDPHKARAGSDWTVFGATDDLGHVIETFALPAFVAHTPSPTEAPTILWLNTAFEHMCGYKRCELVGQSPKVLQGPETDTRLAKQFRVSLETDGSALVDLVNYTKEGVPYEVILLGTRMLFDSKPSALGKVFLNLAYKLGDLPTCAVKRPV